MSKYIDADALIKQRPENFNEQYADHDVAEQNKGWNNCNSYWCKLVDEMPIADVEPVRHGYWRLNACSACGAPRATDSVLDFLDAEDQKYCYACGAKMDGGSK